LNISLYTILSTHSLLLFFSFGSYPPARAKPKSPAKKPAAKAIPVKSAFFDVSFITNDEVSLAPAFGMPLMLTAFFYALYAIDCMGFLVTDTNFMPA
jgi:hypothetical protein